MKIVKQIPNLLTLFNLSCGFLAIICSFDVATIHYAPYLIFIAAIFDFTDGFAARLLKAYSEIGKQLDSLADMVSFGIAPGVIALQLMFMALNTNISSLSGTDKLFLLTALLIPAFSALRLAKFNIDERQTTDFIGLPTPASALLVASLALCVLSTQNAELKSIILNPWLLGGIFIADSLIMVSELKLISLKFKSMNFSKNAIRYIFLILSVVLLAIFTIYAIPMIIVLYIIISLLGNYIFIPKAE